MAAAHRQVVGLPAALAQAVHGFGFERTQVAGQGVGSGQRVAAQGAQRQRQLHGLGALGLAAVLVGYNSFFESGSENSGALANIHSAEVFIGVFIGAVTFTGSIVAFLKLSARIPSNPLMLPGKNVLNVGALVGFVVLTVWYIATPDMWLLVAVTNGCLTFVNRHQKQSGAITV